MRLLITGASGFVGRHLCRYLAKKNDDVIAVTQKTMDVIEGATHQCKCNLENLENICHIFEEYKPDGIIHLAAKSSVAYSWLHPNIAFLNNAQIFANVIEAQRISLPTARFLSIGSSEQYGTIQNDSLPISENMICSPCSPYAVARQAQEQLSQIYSKGYNLDIICTRSFNHIGPGQNDNFVIPSFIKQAREIKLGRKTFFECGDMTIIRDFVDIRDIVRAYRFLILSGEKGEIYNVCTGIGTSLKQILHKIMDIYKIEAPIKMLKNKFRPVDNPIIIGSNQKICNLGFVFKYTLESALHHITE